MSDFTQGYLVGVASMWIGAALVIAFRWLWQQRKIALSPDWAHKTVPVGRILEMSQDEHGITVVGKVDDEHVKIINNLDLLYVSIDAQPNAFGEGIQVYRDTEKILKTNKEN